MGASEVADAVAGHGDVNSSTTVGESAVVATPSNDVIDAALTLPTLRSYEGAILKATRQLEDILATLQSKYKRVRAKMYREHKHAVIAEDNSALERFQRGCPKPKEVWQASKRELDKQAHCLQAQANEVDDSDLVD